MKAVSTPALQSAQAVRIDPSALRTRAVHTPTPRARASSPSVPLALDALAVSCATAVLVLVHGPLSPASTGVLIALLVLWPLAMHRGRARHADLFSHQVTSDLRRVGRCALRVLAVLGCGLWVTGSPTGVVPVVAAVAVTAAVSAAGHLAWRAHQPARRVLVAGSAQRSAELGQRLTGLHPADRVTWARSARTVDQVASAAARDDSDDVVVLCGLLGESDLRRLGWLLEQRHQRLHLATGLFGVDSQRVGVESSGTFSLIGVRPSETWGPRRTLWNLVGRLVALVLLVLSAPFWLVVAVAVRCDSPGPVLFRQQRIGRHGQVFGMVKFRTMTHRAPGPAGLRNDSPGGVLFKAHHDPRVTRVGAVLRRWSVDELPQLLNVVRGEMGLIGPRPALAVEVSRYSHDMHRRLAVRPGMTGLWQVSGRSDLPWDEAIRLDLAYVDNWSPWADLSILARTVPAVLGHRGAY